MAIRLDWLLGAVVAGPGQGHHLVAGGTDFSDPSALHVVAGVLRGITMGSDAVVRADNLVHVMRPGDIR
jgi:hypothetical protein